MGSGAATRSGESDRGKHIMRPVCWRAAIPFIGIPVLIADIIALAAVSSVTRRVPVGAAQTE